MIFFSYLCRMIFNVVPSAFDVHDIILTSESKEIPEVYYIPDKLLGGVKDQGAEGACSAYVAASIKENQERLQIGYKAKFSPDFVYSMRSMKPRPGMTPRETFEIRKNYGILPARYWKIKYAKDGIPPTALGIASNFKIKDYGRVETIKAMKENLITNGVSYMALPVYSYNEEFWKQNVGDVPKGGHAIAVIGYNKEGFILRNSWGLSWGDKGHTVFPFDDWDIAWEAWFIIDDATAIKFRRSGKIIKNG